MSTLQAVELGVLGPLQVRRDGAPVIIPGAKPRAILTMLGLHGGSVVSAETLIELLWGDDPPRTAAKALQTHISSLRRTLGDGFVLTEGTGWTLAESGVDAARYKSAARLGRDAAAAGDTSQAVSRFEEALALWRGIPELPDGRRGTSEKTRWIEGHAALVEDRADALLVTGRAAEIIGELEAAVAEAPLRERRWGQLMLALYRAGRQGDALGAYQRARALLADELGVDPGPDLRRLEAAIVGQDTALEIPAAQDLRSVTRTVTFLLTDIEGSTAAWEADAGAMAAALARHDELVEQVVTSRGGRLIKTRGEGDATFSVFERASAAAAAAIELQDAIFHEPWGLKDPMRIRVALHTGEVELRDGDYFGRAVNRAARLRSLAIGGQILCSGAIAELVVDSLPDDVLLADLGMRQLKNLARPEHVFELRLETAAPPQKPNDAPIERPGLPAVLTGPGPFVGRGRELEGLVSAWQTALAGGTHAVLIAGEPGVGKTRLAGEWSQKAYELEAIVLYGRCDEDLGAPYQPFAEALRSLVPCLGTSRLRGMRGVEALLTLVPGLTEVLPDLAAPTRADPETERYALFDAVVALLELASAGAPVVLVLDDLHWAAKPTLLLLRHLLRFGDRARVQIVGTYRSTDLDRSHPLAAMLADLHRGAGSGTANRLALSGLDEADVTAYVTEAGYNDEELARALASVTGGNPFFLIEALRHVDETGGVWDPTTLPQGVRETVSRRLSRLPAETNTALAAAAVVGSRFALDLVEKVVEQDLVDAFDGACKAGIVIEEPGGRYRFNHAIVRQSLLAELPSVRRQRLHQRIATTLETQPGADDELLAELAHHYFECAWAGNAAKAVEYSRRAADQAVARLAYEGAADLYGQALHALDEIDDELPDRDDQVGELLVARCEALLAAGDVASAAGAVAKLQEATVNSPRLAAWATCFDGQLSMLIHPERLDEVETALGLAAQKLAELDDAAGEANAHTVRAACLARLGRIGDCEIALDDALTAARRARDHRRVNAVLAGAPLAALWGPNPVPRAGGRCLDVVRLLRITTDSPAVEATSTRCQAVLEAFRGRAEAARRMIDSARRTVTELGLRHALLEVEQFAGIVELVADDPAAAETHLRKAYNGFRRMGLDADTAETAALLGRTCLALDRDAEADELCTESERLAGHALKASIAWRTLRAKLLARGNSHDEARRVAEAAVSLAARTDALVDHGDACLSLATVLGTAGDAAGARAAAERAVDLYERKGAAALAYKARLILGDSGRPSAPAPSEPPPVVELDNACIRSGKRLAAAINREAWDEFEQLYAPEVFSESHRKVIGFTHAAGAIVPPEDWAHEVGRILGASGVRLTAHDIAVRGERLALARLAVGTVDASPGAPRDEFLQIYGIDEEGRICLQIFFDLEDMEATIAEFDAVHARFEQEAHRQARRLENAASQVSERHSAHFAARDWDALAKVLADDFVTDDRRRAVNAGIRHGRDAEIANMQAAADVGITYTAFFVIATRGERLILTHASVGGGGSAEFSWEGLSVVEINSDNQIAAFVIFELDDFDAAIAALDARYIAGEAAPHARAWSVIAGAYAAINRHEFPATTPDWVDIDHRGETAFGAGELRAYLRAGLEPDQDINVYIEAMYRLTDLGAVFTYAAHETSHEGFDAEWRGATLMTVEGEMISRSEVFDEADLHTALAKFDQLSRPAPRLENAASQVSERYMAHFAARDWDELAKVLADDICVDDRRRVVNAGITHGRDAEIANLRAAADVGITYFASVVIAARGQRLILARVSGGEGGGSGEFLNEVLGVIEINSDNQHSAIVMFELDDFDAAIVELDARYLAGEAAPHARTWSVITAGYAALNRHELAATTSDWVNIDHRRGTSIAPGEMPELLGTAWNVTSDLSNFIESVHRLDDLGVVITHVANETSQQGFHAEWRVISLMTLDGDLVNRCEVFDEADIDDALTKFDQLTQPAPRLENAASRVYEHFLATFAARDWDAVAQLLADDMSTDDRRRVVNSGIQDGREANVANMRALADLGVMNMTSEVIATRGNCLALSRIGSAAFQTEVLNIVEIDADDRIVAVVGLDLDDFEAALAELDARYLAGEAAAHAGTWSVITGSYAAFNRHEVPATEDWVTIDHRRGTPFEPSNMTPSIRTIWDLTPDLSIHIEAVHRINNSGAVITHHGYGSSQEGFDAEWRAIDMLMVDGERINRCEVFDETDLDAALMKFDQLSRRSTPRPENSASQVYEHFLATFAARDWAAMAELMADDYYGDDRRPVVGIGIQRGRDAMIRHFQTAPELEVTHTASDAIATRGDRLILTRTRFSRIDEEPDAFRVDLLHVVEINIDERISAIVAFDSNDFEAAIAELDARYLAGEAAAYVGTWSVIAGVFVAHNRREIAAVTTDAVSLDHRRGAAFAPGEGFEYIRAGWDLDQTLNIYVETAHRVNDFGAVFTWAGHGTSHEGFDAEWRGVTVMTVDSEMVSRMEVFDEEDLEAALAKFDQLSRPTPRLENAASRMDERLRTHLAAREWAAMANLLTEDTCTDDRRRIVNVGIRRGRDVTIAYGQAMADLGVKIITSDVVAIRGERLFLSRARWLGPDQRPEDFHTEVLNVVEIDPEQRIAARVMFDADDIDAAFAELDARYIAGEAAPYRDAWSVIAAGYAALNRYEVPPSAPDYVNIDHRLQATFEAPDLGENLRAAWDLTPELKGHIEVVHRLSGLGAVVTHAAHGTTQDGLDAEWRGIHFLTLEGGMVNRCEIYDEADLDAAVTRFEQLSLPALQLKTFVAERLAAHIAARDWEALAQDFADDYCLDDRRRVVNAGVMHGRDAGVENTRVAAEVGLLTNTTSTIIASRGERLTLERFHASGADHESIQNEALNIVEIDADERIAAVVMFDVDDIDAAFGELDARYLAGEAAPHAYTWSVIARIYAGFNRREPPATTPDSVFTDHRPLQNLGAVDLVAAIRSMWDVASDFNVCIEAVHRLSELGAVVTQTLKGTSQEGLDAEWRTIEIFTVEGDLLSRCEAFDETDLDAALARFEELRPPPPGLENAAGRILARYFACFSARDWADMTELLADDVVVDDRRRVVNAGVRRGRDVYIADNQAAVEVGADTISSSVIATRGKRLALARVRSVNRGMSGEVGAEMLGIVEIDSDERIVAGFIFDISDIDAAFAELDARYLAGEAAAHAQTWSAITGVYAAFNRRELPAPDYVAIDHRRATLFTSSELAASIRDSLDLTPDLIIHIEAVHRLNNFGALVTNTSYGSSQEGFDAEWRMIQLLIVEGDRVNRLELFDEADLDAALARFEELQPQPRRLENAASQVAERFWAYFESRDWDAMAEIIADDCCTHDRRRVVNADVLRGRVAHVTNMRAVAEVGFAGLTSTVLATREHRLALIRIHSSARGSAPGEVTAEMLSVVEIDTDNRLAGAVIFDSDDIDAAFEELDARYLAGEAAAHAHTWSVIARINAAFNRRELPEADWVTIDHRPLPLIEADSQAALQVWEVTPDFDIRSETVHRLGGFGAVATYQANGASPEGFGGEWRIILLLTVEGDRIDRCEVFDESDLDAALLRFEELQPQAPRLENAASRIIERYLAHFAARDWAALAKLLADDIVSDDRRRVVNAGIRRGRDVHIADNRVVVEVSVPTMSSNVIAARGERLALAHLRIFNRGMSGEVGADVLGIAEIDADERIVALVTFDLDDIDAAYEELDARYLAGEAAAHAHAWSVIRDGYATLNRHELPPTTPDFVNIDHRRGGIAFAPGDLLAFVRASWDDSPTNKIYVEALHRLTNVGAVVTSATHGVSLTGFDAGWREIGVVTVDGDMINRCELFDEADLDAALARFEELQPQARLLENAATQVAERLRANFSARDWTARAELLADDCSIDDRRRVVNAGNQHGRDADITNMRAIAAVGVASIALTTIATRGERLALSRARMSGRDQRPEAFYTETLTVLEVDANNRAAAQVVFDPDDIDAAFEELEARYLAGEAAAHAHTWSVIARTTAAFNRHELPAADWVIIDHRPLAPIDASDLPAAIRAIWDLTPDLSTRTEAVHRLSSFGALVTNTAYGTSPEGFAAEWRVVDVVTVEGDRITRDEFFDEADLDAALARFDELQPQAPRLENAASQLVQRFRAYFAERNWAAVAENSADEVFTDDRRSVVSSGILHGRDVDLANIRAIADLGATDLTSTVIATRGERLVLTRLRLSGRDQRPEAFRSEMLGIVEIDADNRVAARFLFDLNDIDAAFAELDARYLAGEAAEHAHAWSVITLNTAAFNRHELLATDWVTIDHRPLVTIEANDLSASMRAIWDLAPDMSIYMEAVHRLSDTGAVVTAAVYGTSLEGFAAEWRMVDLLTVEGDRISLVEFFDEVDLDAALARFDELERRTPSIENVATRTWLRVADAFNCRDAEGLLGLANTEGRYEDRRKGLRNVLVGPARRKAVHAMFETMPSSWRLELEFIAIRGSRLSLTRERYRDIDEIDRPITSEILRVMEVDDRGLMQDAVSFDPDDLDDAFAELTARWIASGEVAYPEPIEAVDRINAAINRHDWDAVATYFAGAEYVNHRQLGHAVNGTIADWLSSRQTAGSLVSNFWVELAEILARSAIGIVGRMAVKGTSTDGVAIEITFVVLILLHGECVTRLEAFEEDQRDVALARLQEFNRPV